MSTKLSQDVSIGENLRILRKGSKQAVSEDSEAACFVSKFFLQKFLFFMCRTQEPILFCYQYPVVPY